jgi:hypothetical protein
MRLGKGVTKGSFGSPLFSRTGWGCPRAGTGPRADAKIAVHPAPRGKARLENEKPMPPSGVEGDP